MSFSLRARVVLGNLRFDSNPVLTMSKLRDLYARHNVKLRTLNTKQTYSIKKIIDINDERLARLPKVLRLMN